MRWACIDLSGSEVMALAVDPLERVIQAPEPASQVL